METRNKAMRKKFIQHSKHEYHHHSIARRREMILFKSLLQSQQKRYFLWPSQKSSTKSAYVPLNAYMSQREKGESQVIKTFRQLISSYLSNRLMTFCLMFAKISFLIYLLNIHPIHSLYSQL